MYRQILTIAHSQDSLRFGEVEPSEVEILAYITMQIKSIFKAVSRTLRTDPLMSLMHLSITKTYPKY